MAKPIEELTLEECLMVFRANVGISDYFVVEAGNVVRQKTFEELSKAEVLNLEEWRFGINRNPMVIKTRYPKILERMCILLELYECKIR